MTEAIFGEQYLAASQKVFNIAERKFSLSGDSFDIKDENDNKVYIADGNAFRAKKMIRLLSAEDKSVIATIGKDEEGEGYYLKKGDTMQVAFQYKASDDFAAGTSVGAKIEMFAGGTGAYPEFYVARAFDEKTFVVMHVASESEVCKITYDFNLGKRDIWSCNVNEGVDEVLMVATTIMIDEILETEG